MSELATTTNNILLDKIEHMLTGLTVPKDLTIVCNSKSYGYVFNLVGREHPNIKVITAIDEFMFVNCDYIIYNNKFQGVKWSI